MCTLHIFNELPWEHQLEPPRALSGSENKLSNYVNYGNMENCSQSPRALAHTATPHSKAFNLFSISSLSFELQATTTSLLSVRMDAAACAAWCERIRRDSTRQNFFSVEVLVLISTALVAVLCNNRTNSTTCLRKAWNMARVELIMKKHEEKLEVWNWVSHSRWLVWQIQKQFLMRERERK